MRRWWWLMVCFFIIVLVGIIIVAPKILGSVFERVARITEQQFINSTPEEYHARIMRDFEVMIKDFKENKLRKEDLTQLSQLIKNAYEDKKYSVEEIDNILLFIEKIISLGK